MNQATQKIIKGIAEDLLRISYALLDSPGMGLRESALRKDLRVKMLLNNDSPVVRVIFNDYIDYIEQGRKPRQGKRPPIDALRDWALRRNIPTDNATLFLISRAIWENGFRARPILATLEQQIGKYWENTWSEQLFDVITHQLSLIFEKQGTTTH